MKISSILSMRAGAEQQLATSYLWFAIFLLISPSLSVLLLPLSSQLFFTGGVSLPFSPPGPGNPPGMVKRSDEN